MAARTGAVPVVLSIVLSAALNRLGLFGKDLRGDLLNGVTGLLLEIAIFTSPTTAWYRAVIFGAAEAGRQPLFSLSPRVRRLLGWQVGLAVLLIAPLAALWWLADAFERAGQTGLYAATVLALGTATLLVLIAVCRLSMVLALAAADQPASLGAAGG